MADPTWHQLSAGTLINMYCLPAGKRFWLVDTGLPGMGRWIGWMMRRRGISLDQLQGVLLTHFHTDHAGSAGWFRRRGIPVYALTPDVRVLNGEDSHPGYTGLAGKVVGGVEWLAGGHPRLDTVEPMEPGQELPGTGWEILAVPGHTRGSLALWQPETGELLSGDTLVTTWNLPRGPVPMFTANVPQARKSALALLDREPKRVLPGHGPVLGAGRFEKLRVKLKGVVDPCSASGRSHCGQD